MTGKNQHVVPQGGAWAVVTEGSTRIGRVFDRKADAIDAAQEIARATKGAVIVHGRHGQPFLRAPLPSKINEAKVRRIIRDGSLDRSRSIEVKKLARKTAGKLGDGIPDRSGTVGNAKKRPVRG